MDATIAYLQSQIQDAPHPPPGTQQILHIPGDDDDDQAWHPSSAHNGKGGQPEAQLHRICSTSSMKICRGEFICYPEENHAEASSAVMVAAEHPRTITAHPARHLDLMHQDQHQSCETPVHLGSSPTSSGTLRQPTSTATTTSLYHPISSSAVIADDAADFSEHSMVKTISELMMTPLMDWSWQHQAIIQEQMHLAHHHDDHHHDGDEERSAASAVKKEDPEGHGNVSAASSKTSDGKSHDDLNAGNDDNDSGSVGAVISTDDNHNPPFSPMSDTSLPDYES